MGWSPPEVGPFHPTRFRGDESILLPVANSPTIDGASPTDTEGSLPFVLGWGPPKEGSQRDPSHGSSGASALRRAPSDHFPLYLSYAYSFIYTRPLDRAPVSPTVPHLRQVHRTPLYLSLLGTRSQWCKWPRTVFIPFWGRGIKSHFDLRLPSLYFFLLDFSRPCTPPSYVPPKKKSPGPASDILPSLTRSPRHSRSTQSWHHFPTSAERVLALQKPLPEHKEPS